MRRARQRARTLRGTRLSPPIPRPRARPPSASAVFCQLAARVKKAPAGALAVATAEAAFAAFDPEGTGAVSAAAFRDIFSSTLAETAAGGASVKGVVDAAFLDALAAYADPDMSGTVRYGPFLARLEADARAAELVKARETVAGAR